MQLFYRDFSIYSGTEEYRRKVAEIGENAALQDAYTNMHTKGYTYIIAVEIAKSDSDGADLDEDDWNEKRVDWLNDSGGQVVIRKMRIIQGGSGGTEKPFQKTIRIKKHQKPPGDTRYGFGKSYPTYKENYYFVACMYLMPPGIFYRVSHN